ncbi:MAG: magnesium transporter [Candidatus Promineifilaceae bacterium]|nr:magnesium transporter [Candidatus Promineifilaceae bacterium]
MEESPFNLPSVEEIQGLIEQQQLESLRGMLSQVHPADIADVLDQLSPDDVVTIFGLLSTEAASEVLDESGSLVRQELIEKVDDERLADLLDELPMDDAAEFLEDLPEPVADRLLELMEQEEAEDVRELLAYEDETAGRLMTRDVAAIRRTWTVRETEDFLRSLEEPETLAYLYVVDRDDKLIGVIPLRDFVLAKPDAIIESIMATDVVSAPVTIDQEELAEMISRYDFVALPVTDEDGRLLGIVTVDDILDVYEEEVTEDIQRLGGSEPLDKPYFTASIPRVFSKRIGWLLLLFLAGTLTGAVTKLYQEQLEAAIILTLFVPLIIGTGGNAGSQTVATIIRAITLDEVRVGNLWQAIRREISVGFLLGLVMGAVGFMVAVFWTQDVQVAAVIALTLPAVVIWAITVATVVPTVADRFNIDPTVISGPMITTIVDATGLLIYFQLATIILGLQG